jgi:hypothetical protein
VPTERPIAKRFQTKGEPTRRKWATAARSGEQPQSAGYNGPGSNDEDKGEGGSASLRARGPTSNIINVINTGFVWKSSLSLPHGRGRFGAITEGEEGTTASLMTAALISGL